VLLTKKSRNKGKIHYFLGYSLVIILFGKYFHDRGGNLYKRGISSILLPGALVLASAQANVNWSKEFKRAD